MLAWRTGPTGCTGRRQGRATTLSSAEVGNGSANDAGTGANQDRGLAVRLQAEGANDALTGPVSRFDDEAYLARNGDVRAAGHDPLRHYLEYGQGEGRSITPMQHYLQYGLYEGRSALPDTTFGTGTVG
jgi:hypothetical protein